MAEHNTLTDPQLHEPKGIATADTDQIYIANGAGSGAWTTPPYTTLDLGVWDYNDAATSTTPIALTLANTDYELTNDGAGTFTNTTYKLVDVGDIWNVSTNRFDWSGLSLGDTVDIRTDITWTSSGANQTLTLSLELGVGGNPYTIRWINDHLEKNSGTHRFTLWNSIYMGDINTLNNPARWLAQSDSTGTTIEVAGWYIKALSK